MLKFDASIFGGELPVGLGVVGITVVLPGGDFVDEEGAEEEHRNAFRLGRSPPSCRWPLAHRLARPVRHRRSERLNRQRLPLIRLNNPERKNTCEFRAAVIAPLLARGLHRRPEP